MNTKRLVTAATLSFIGALLLSLTITAPAQTPRFQITAFTDLGGGVSSGGAFAVSGSIGQSDAGTPSGGPFAVLAGFWGTVQTSVEPLLHAAFLNGAVIVSWNKLATGWFLEQTQNLPGTLADWSIVAFPYETNATSIGITVTVPVGTKYYRLKKP